MFVRPYYQQIKERVEEPKKFIQIVMGPRQVGKTTLVKQVLEHIETPFLSFSADDVPTSQRSWISDCWQAARIKMAAQNLSEMLLVIDEIQKIQSWSETVKKEWDADIRNDVNIKVLLTGSSRVLLERGLADSLAGRFEVIRIPHWSFAEMREAFDFSLDQYIYFGAYPGAASLIHDEQRWRDYIHSAIIDATINKDILMSATINKPALLREAFELSSAYSGQMLSLTKMLGQLQDVGNVTTLSSYIQLLSDSGLVCSLQKYSKDKARRRASVPKFQVFNNALQTVYSEYDFDQVKSQPRLWGRIYESAVGTHIVNQMFSKNIEAYYWNDGYREVDFIVTSRGKTAAIEVKSNNEVGNAGLALFRERFDPQAAFVVGQGGLDIETFFSTNLQTIFGERP